MQLPLSLALLASLLSIPADADARKMDDDGKPSLSSGPAEDPLISRYRCDVKRDLTGGTATLTRLFTDEGKNDSGDFMRWNPKSYDPSRRARPLDVELSYIWEPASQPAVEPRAIDVELRVGLDADLPDMAWIQMQRPFPVKPYGIIAGTALSTQVFPYSTHDMKNGHGELPLGDLLAYAEGYDALDWTLIRPSDRLGGAKELARGKIDIKVLREAVTALPTLRKALAVKIADPKTRCERVSWPNRPIH